MHVCVKKRITGTQPLGKILLRKVSFVIIIKLFGSEIGFTVNKDCASVMEMLIFKGYLLCHADFLNNGILVIVSEWTVLE